MFKSRSAVLLTLGVPRRAYRQRSRRERRRSFFAYATKVNLKSRNDADIAIVEPGITSLLTREELLDRHKLSPFIGREFRGRIEAARCCAGPKTIFVEGKIAELGQGQLVKPQA